MSILNIEYNNKQIKELRVKIENSLISNSKTIKNNKLEQISTNDLYLLFDLYDKYVFNNFFANNFNEPLNFSLSKKMTRAAGKTIVTSRQGSSPSYEIRMGINFFFQYYLTDSEKKVSGIITTSPLEAFLIVFEHEICHLIEFYKFGNSSCKKNAFKNMAYKLFKHTDVYHALPTNSNIAGKVYNLHLGDLVEFEYNSKTLQGTISNITKRATVMVKDNKGLYRDNKGYRYAKFYIPLTLLKRIQ